MTLCRYIFPTHNRVEWLKESMSSVLRSKDVEIWVLANGCTDGTDEYLAALTDPRVHYFSRPENLRGGYYELARRLPDQEGYLCLWSDDDHSLPMGIERKRQHLDHNPEVDMVFSTVRLMNAEGEDKGLGAMGMISKRNMIGEALDFERLIIKDYIPTPTVLMRLASFAPLLGILQETDFALADWQLWLHAAATGRRGSFLFDPTISYRTHDKSDSAHYVGTARYIEDHLAVWRYWRSKGYTAIPEDYRAIEAFLLGICHLCKRSAAPALQELERILHA